MMRGKGKKLTIYLDESQHWHGKPTVEVLIDRLHHREVRGVTVFKGVAGFGEDGTLHTTKILRLAEHLPIVVVVVETEDVVSRILPEISDIVEHGLIEVSDTEIVQGCEHARKKAG